jgi:signal peptidase I
MQPTLNGIVGTPLKKEDWPSFPQRMLEKVLRGRSYVYEVTDRDRRLAVTPQGALDIRDTQFLHFFSRSILNFSDSPPIRLPAPSNPISEIGLRDALGKAIRNNGLIPKGTVLCEGTVDSGDLVLVNKFSYHFRKPTRGEVFVFDTIGIAGIQQRSGDQGAGSHYIKRLCGVPGDKLSIRTPNLYVNGKIADEPGIQRVIRGEGPYSLNHGYSPASPNEPLHHGKKLPQYLASETATLTLAADTRPGMREYAALGDNTGNSLDSRYWGTVKEFNLVGPALFSLWPITTGHWGLIR